MGLIYAALAVYVIVYLSWLQARNMVTGVSVRDSGRGSSSLTSAPLRRALSSLPLMKKDQFGASDVDTGFKTMYIHFHGDPACIRSRGIIYAGFMFRPLIMLFRVLPLVSSRRFPGKNTDLRDSWSLAI